MTGRLARGLPSSPRTRGGGFPLEVQPLDKGIRNYSVTGLSEICQSLPSKIEMWSVFIGE